MNRKVQFDEDRFIRFPEGQRSLSDQGSHVFLRDGLLAKQTVSRKEEEVDKIVSDLVKVVLSGNGKETILRIKLHRTELDLEKVEHEFNECVFKNKTPRQTANSDTVPRRLRSCRQGRLGHGVSEGTVIQLE